jgi:sterol desaturase/sphingolipid hydroxylase (fatty acid hydroxylase superfamily)
MYVWHRINHVIPFLWRFHRVYHNDATMDVTTASRFHTGEIAISSALRVGIVLLFGIYLWELVLYETVMFAVVQFHHANVKLPDAVDRALRAVIVTPDMHKVHHSRYQPKTDSNYSSLFSFWDRIGRSFRLREDPSTIELGLHGWDAPEDQCFMGLLWAPLKKTGHCLRRSGFRRPRIGCGRRRIALISASLKSSSTFASHAHAEILSFEPCEHSSPF